MKKKILKGITLRKDKRKGKKRKKKDIPIGLSNDVVDYKV